MPSVTFLSFEICIKFVRESTVYQHHIYYQLILDICFIYCFFVLADIEYLIDIHFFFFVFYIELYQLFVQNDGSSTLANT